ncbi:MAG: type II secretion system F family protein [Spirochaetes bacterium]|nr:type II secretion system F family protein [Spirochaetota bacterium]
MPLYKCIVTNGAGRKSEIIKEVSGENELISSFGKLDGFLLSFNEINKKEVYKAKKHFNHDTISAFTDIMASLLNAGLNLQNSLELCAVITDNAKVKKLCASLAEGMKRGDSFNSLLKIYSSSFSPLYQALVRLGEQTGSVGKVFERMSSYLQSSKAIRDKIINALMYPAIVLFVAIIGCFAIVLYILPKMTDIFLVFNSGANNNIGIEIERIYNSLWIFFGLFIMFLSGIAAAIILYKASERFASLFDNFILKIPLIGTFISYIQTLNFAFAMEMLTAAGINVSKALSESVIVVSNRSFKKSIIAINEDLKRGEAMSDAFLKCKEFPSYVGTWIAVGERTGKVSHIFEQIRKYFQNTINNSTQKMMNMIEPILILLIGVVVFILVIQFVLPVFALYGKVL